MESLQTLQALFDNAAVGIALIGLDGKWLRVNQRYCQMIGYTESELHARTLKDITHPDDCAGVLAARTALLEGTISSHSMEKRYIRKDGTIFWGRLNRSLVRDQDNVPKFFIAIVEDITAKVAAEHALRERDQQLELAQSAALLGVWSRDLSTNVTVTSGYYGRLRGLDLEKGQITHEEWLSKIHPGDRERVEAALQECIDRTHVWDEEFRVVWPDGSVRWLLVKGQVFLDNAQRPTRLAGVSLDITDRKQIGEALRQSEERFRLAVKATNDAIWDIDAETGVATWNETHSNLYGGPPEKSDSRQWWIDRIHPEDRERAVDGLRSAIDSDGNSWTCEYRFRRADGAWADIYDRAYIARNPSGKAERVIGAMQDLTERRQAEALQRDNDRQYKEVFENISVCLFLIDVVAEGRFKYVGFNPAEEKAVGVSNSEVAGKFVEEVFPKHLADKLIANYNRCLNAGRAITFDDALDLPLGRRYFHSNLIPLRNADGVIQRIIGACIDSTDLMRTQEEALAKQNLESLGVLAGGIAHDFNNVLGGINAQAELIEADLPVDSALRAEIQKIKTSAMRGSEMVRELMVYAGEDETYLHQGIDISLLVKETLGLLRLSMSKHAILRTTLAEDLPAVSGSAPQIRQVVMNLIINASEAIGHKDGTITLTTTHVKNEGGQGLDRPADLPPGDYVRMDVTDTGGGIPEAVKPKMFDPFFTTKFAGRGMGLAVVHRIVHDHGGAIRVTSVVGGGTTFQVFLPCAKRPASEDLLRLDPETLPKRASERTILVADDEELLRMAISKSLRKLGFSVLEASDGSEAMTLLCANKHELQAVLLDLTLPGASSREILEEARRIRPDLRIVLTSAYGKETVERTFPGLPVQYFIRKPFAFRDLVSSLIGEGSETNLRA